MHARTLVFLCLATWARLPSAAVEAGAPITMTTIASAHVLACGFGGIGPYVPPPRPNAYVAAAIEVTGSSTDTKGVSAIEIELLDSTGHVVARGVAPTLSVIPSTRAPNDYSRTGATPFDGKVLAGAHMRLLVESTLDVRDDALKPTPQRVRITLVDDHGNRTTFAGAAVGPWPTA